MGIPEVTGGQQVDPRGATQKRTPGRRDQIIEAAAEVFVANGYEGASMREIAKRVGVTEGALYRHFRSKEELYSEVVGATSESIDAWFARTLRAADTMTVREAVRALLQVSDARRSGSSRTAIRVALWSDSVKHPEYAALYTDMLAHYMRCMEEFCRRVDDREGISRPEDELTSKVRAWTVFLTGATLVNPLMPGSSEQLIDDLASAFITMMGWEEVAHG